MSAKHKVGFLANRHNRMKVAAGAIMATMAIAGSAVLASTTAFAGPSPVALACPVGTVDLGVSGKIVCEVNFTSTPGSDFVFPNYVHSAEALIVGAGGSSVGGYAGGGGEVKVVSLDTATDAKVTVGTSNTGFGTSNVTQGTTSHNADAGTDGYDGSGVSPVPVPGQSGNGNAGSEFQTGVGAGGGAGSIGGNGAVDASDELSLYGGNGVQPSDITSTDSLFYDNTTCFGGGGSAWSSSYGTQVTGAGLNQKIYYSPGQAQGGVPTNVYCAGGYATNSLYDSTANNLNATLSVVKNGITYKWHSGNSVPDYIASGVTATAPTANSGGGAGAYSSQAETIPGANGYVSIRFQLLRDIYVVPSNKNLTYGDNTPTYDYQLCTDANCTGGPITGPAGMTDPTCTSDYVPFSSTTGDVAHSPRDITCSGGSKLGYNFITTPTATLTIVKADALCEVTAYDVVYDGTAKTDNGSCTGVNGEDLSSDLTVADSNTNAGDYKGEGWSFTDTTGNYNNQSGTVDNYIHKADANCSVGEYHVTYDGNSHQDVGSCTGVNGEDLSTDLTVAGSHTDAGNYPAEPWSYNDTTGNYNNTSGTSDNSIDKADASCSVGEYHVTYDGTPYQDQGSCTGVNGEDLSGDLTVAGPHTNAGNYPAEPWSYNDTTGNYNNTSGTSDNSIDKADASCSVGEYHVTFDGKSHQDVGSCSGVNGEDLSGGLTVAGPHTNAGTYPAEPWSFTDPNGNYNSTSGTSDNSIDKADANCSVNPYDVFYDGNSHQDTGSCTDVDGNPLSGLTVADPHTNAGSYPTEGWSFTDASGNYNNTSGTVDNLIRKATATCSVTAYNVQYDGNSHVDTGSCHGLNNVDLSGGLTVSPGHTPVGDYLAEGWSFTDVSGNYEDQSGTVDNYITKIPTNVNYTGGPSSLNPGTSLNLSNNGVPALCTTAVVYTLDVNPLTGAAGPYTLTGPVVDTTGWLPGNYVITVSYPTGDPICIESTNTSNLTVTNPVVPPVVDPCGTEAEIERYALTHQEDGCETENHNSENNDNSGSHGDNSGSETRHEGDVRWEFKDCWKFSGTSTGYAKIDSRNARVTAVGTLSYWNKTTKAWVAASSAPVKFSANFLSAGSNAKSPVTLSSFFGVSVSGTRNAGAPALPSFATTNALHGTFKFN